MKIMRGRMPPGGLWHYYVADGVKLEAVNEEMLQQKIFDYRMRHNIPIGNITRDLDDYYCKTWPDACHKEPADWMPDVPQFEEEPLMIRVTRWAQLMWHVRPRGGFELVANAEAERRAAICQACPMNRRWRGGCSGCSASVDHMLLQLRGQRKTSKDGSLNGCAVAGWENPSACHFKVDNLPLSEEQLGKLPAQCWRKP